jgi:hypothetical protein
LQAAELKVSKKTLSPYILEVLKALPQEGERRGEGGDGLIPW